MTKVFIALATFLAIFFASQSSMAANDITLTIEQSMKSSTLSLVNMKDEVDDIVKQYFATGSSDLIVGVSGDSTPVTVGSKLTKGKFVNGITMAQNLQNMLTNVAVTSGDYMSTSMNLINGTTAANAVLSEDVEVIGTRLVTLANSLIQLKKSCGTILNQYNSSELSGALTQLQASTIVFGCSTPKLKFIDGMNLCSQMINFMQNASVTQGDWMSTVTKWASGI